jgi:hypothetical protein
MAFPSFWAESRRVCYPIAGWEDNVMRRFFPVLWLVLWSPAALAQDEIKVDPQFPSRMFAGTVNKGPNYACFVRVYDGAHLKRHPQQKVKMMKLLVTGEPAEDKPGLSYSFRMGVAFVKRPGNFDSSGECGLGPMAESTPGKTIMGCGVDCDGGGITVELKPDNSATLVRLERIRIWQNNKPDEDGLDLSGGADDKLFRLDRARLDHCKSLITDRKELAAIRSIENRK